MTGRYWIASVIVNGELRDWPFEGYKTERGVRQGCEADARHIRRTVLVLGVREATRQQYDNAIARLIQQLGEHVDRGAPPCA